VKSVTICSEAFYLLPDASSVVVQHCKHNSCNKSLKHTFPFVANINLTGQT